MIRLPDSDSQYPRQYVRNLRNSGEVAFVDKEVEPQTAYSLDIYSGHAHSLGHPEYDGYRTMTLFTVNDRGDVGGRGTPIGKPEGSQPIARVSDTWRAPEASAEMGDAEIWVVGRGGALAGSAAQRGVYLATSTGGADDWVLLPRLNDPPQEYEFHSPEWFHPEGHLYGTATLKWYEWAALSGEYIKRAVRWSNDSGDWQAEQLLPAPAGYAGNDDPANRTADSWRSGFVAGNASGVLLGWLQRAHEAPTRGAMFEPEVGWRFLPTLSDAQQDPHTPTDLNRGGAASGSTSSVGVVWDTSSDLIWNLNYTLDPSIPLVIGQAHAINDRGQLLVSASCGDQRPSLHILSPKSLPAPNFDAHDLASCHSTPQAEVLGAPGNGNLEELAPPGAE